MNIFGISFVLTFLISFFVSTYVLYKDFRSPLNVLFFLLLFFIGEDALVEFHILIAESGEEAQFWVDIINIWPIILALLMHFTLTFLQDKRHLSAAFILLCYVPAIIFIVLELIPGYIELVATKTDFGWTYKLLHRDNISSVIMNAWAAIISIFLVVISIYYWIKGDNKIKRRQAAFVFWGNIVITLGAIISNVFLARLGERVPNTTMFGFLIGSVILGVGVWKYRIFNISITGAAENIVDAMPEALFLLNKGNTIIENNPAAFKLTGLSPQKLLGSKFSKLFESNSADIIKTHLSDQKSKKEKSILTDIDLVNVNNELIPVSLTFSTIYDLNKNVQGYICIARDLKEIKQSESENKILQSQLYQSQKMESIGRLAGGIAHDFNNMLAAISGYAEMIDRKFSKDNPKLKKYVGIIESAAERSAELTTKLLTFARKGNVELKILSVHEAIAESVSILEHTIPKNIKIEIFLDASNPIVFADLTQLQNMFLNFCVNARDAMPKGGKLIIKTENVELKGRVDKISHRQLVNGEYIRVSFCDNGIGMEDDVKEKIFEPFFTTKEQGKGTGLGLASAFGTVQTLGGSIEVDSKIDEWTMFKIYLPTTNEKPQESNLNKTMHEHIGEGRILIIDDEDVVRSVALDMCRNLGYVPISAGSAKTAISYYRKHSRDVEVVILDIIMPEMDGPVCYKELLKINPDLKVIFASGYTKDENIDALLENPNARFIQKPFRVRELSKVISELIS